MDSRIFFWLGNFLLLYFLAGWLIFFFFSYLAPSLSFTVFSIIRDNLFFAAGQILVHFFFVWGRFTKSSNTQKNSRNWNEWNGVKFNSKKSRIKRRRRRNFFFCKTRLTLPFFRINNKKNNRIGHTHTLYVCVINRKRCKSILLSHQNHYHHLYW